jgi:Tfp pilus assembly protein PilO
LVTSKQFKEMMHMNETFNKTTMSMNKTFNKTTTSMNEMFHKSQASTETTLEQVQHGITAIADRVQTLETRLPNAATDRNVVANTNAAAAATHVDDDPFAEDLGVDNDEHFKLPDPPPRPSRPFNRQGMGGNQNHLNQ